MYRLLIVEDEDIICRGLKEKIPWQEIGFVVVGEANDGDMACLMSQDLIPDAILTDIKMPVMDGIAFIQNLREMSSDAEVVVFTGYDDFEYARKCIAFGVAEYLLKPIQNDVIISTFLRLKKKLDTRNNKVSEFDHIKEKTMLLLPLAKEKILQDILENRTNQDDIDRLFSILDIPYEQISIFGVGLFHIEQQFEQGMPEDCDRDCLSQIIEDVSIQFTSYRLIDILCPNESGLVVAIWNTQLINDADEGRAICTAICDRMIRLSSIDGQIVISVGIGMFLKDIHELNRSYRQAKIALMQKFYIGLGKVVCYSDLHENVRLGCGHFIEKNVYESKLTGKIVDAIMAGETLSIEKYIWQYCYVYLKINRYHSEHLVMRVIELILKLSGTIEEQGISFQSVYDGEIDQEVKYLVEEKTINHLHDWLLVIAHRISSHLVCKENINSIDHMIEVVKQYIHKNYQQRISNKELCSMAMASPSYFSNMFKQKTGYALLEYVIMVRIQKAKELLARSDNKVYEVASIVGYDDYRHFSKQFKKMEHMSPSEFRDSYERKLSKGSYL